MLWTDTANFRNPHYHRPSDLPDTLDYEFMARVTELLIEVVKTGASGCLEVREPRPKKTDR